MQFVSKPRREVVWVTIQSVSATGMKQVSLKSEDGPVVLGTGNRVLERESSTQNWGSEGCFEIPKAKLNLSLQRCFPTYSSPSTCGKWSFVFYVWDTNEAIQGQGWEFQGSNLSRGPRDHREGRGGTYTDDLGATWPLWRLRRNIYWRPVCNIVVSCRSGRKVVVQRTKQVTYTRSVFCDDQNLLLPSWATTHKKGTRTIKTWGSRIVVKALRMLRCWDHRLCPYLEATFRMGESLLVSRISKLDYQLCYICSQNMKGTHKAQ